VVSWVGILEKLTYDLSNTSSNPAKLSWTPTLSRDVSG